MVYHPSTPQISPRSDPRLQVLFKRKPVQFLVPPVIEDESDEVSRRNHMRRDTELNCLQVWLIPQTGEVFATYEEYLNRYGSLTTTLHHDFI